MDTLKLLPDRSLETTLRHYFEHNKKPTSQLVTLEVYEDTAYIAVRHNGLTQAFICPIVHLDPQTHRGYHLMVDREYVQCETSSPRPHLVTAGFLATLTPSDLFLSGAERHWRDRATAHVERVKAAATGERLLGRYTGALGAVSYNATAKEEFRGDALRFLRKLAQVLGWPPIQGRHKTGIAFNPGGIAVSGEATLRLQLNADVQLMVEISSSGLLDLGRHSASGTMIMWRFEHAQAYRPPFHNRFPNWSLDVHTFADLIRGATVCRPELQPAHTTEVAA